MNRSGRSVFDDWLKCPFCGSEQAEFTIIDTWDPDTGNVLEKRPALKCRNCGHTRYTDEESEVCSS